MTLAPLPYFHDGGQLPSAIGPELWCTRLGSTTPQGQVGRYDAGARTYLGTLGNYGSNPGGSSGPGGDWGMCLVGSQIWITLPESSSGPGPAIMRINRDGSSAGANITHASIVYPRGLCFDGTNVWVADRGVLGYSNGGIWVEGTGGHISAFGVDGTHVGDFGYPFSPGCGGHQRLWESYAISYESSGGGHIWVLTLRARSLGLGTDAVVFDTGGTYLGSNGSAESAQVMITVDNAGTKEYWISNGATLQRWSTASVLLSSTSSAGGSMVQMSVAFNHEVWMVNGGTITRFNLSGVNIGSFSVSGVPPQTETNQAFVFAT